ncbi:P-loop containing nucleoside triphosphate hydrolase protein [Dichomitus squalens]|uniref:Origin recognition complex subunit 1 n=1 Tax=Dichomitus squalens TaxID=114155 RepID=A0A4Q9QEH7_9APHY|nr:P-loop containing nucleoside triphosphate hydrolase protein [Dichomitus squalens]TBU65194.1 P-loop containing nucleoside triphosphate hydrolase protein [Dichomitus squalens]
MDDEGYPSNAPLHVLVHWFVRPNELPKHRVQREFCENEVLYHISGTAVIPAFYILNSCTVSSSSASAIRTSTTVSSVAKVSHTSFFCRLAVDPQRGLYYELNWDALRESALKTVPSEDNHLEHDESATVAWPNTRRGDGASPRKRRRLSRTAIDHASDSDPDAEGSEDEFQASHASVDEDEDGSGGEPSEDEAEDDHDSLAPDEPRTPSRRGRGKRKRAPTTPRTPRTPKTPRRPRADRVTLAQPTPHSKAALRRRKKTALAVRPPPPAEGTLELALSNGLEGDAWERAMHVLHVAARPGALPCREQEYGRVLRAVEELLEEGSGGCIYISGVPGTGKTATVHAVVRELKRMAEQNEANPFAYVEINGLKIPEPNAAYGLLWEAVCGHDAARDGHMKISAKEALRNLSKHFSNASREQVGPTGSHACVVLMDELDQLMTTKQDVVYNFFNWPTLAGSKLVVLAVANTMDLPERVMTGRVRSRLGMVRINFQPYTTPQLESIVKARLLASKTAHPPLPPNTPDVLAPDALKFAAMKVASISGDARRVLDICRRTVELVHPLRKPARTEDVKAVIKEMQNSPTAAYLRELAFHERLLLASLLKCVRREGVEEIKWADVQNQHRIYLNLLADDDPSRRPSPDELLLVFDALLASHALIAEEGAAVARKPEGERRIALNLEYAEVERVLGEVGGPKWRNALNV